MPVLLPEAVVDVLLLEAVVVIVVVEAVALPLQSPAHPVNTRDAP